MSQRVLRVSAFLRRTSSCFTAVWCFTSATIGPSSLQPPIRRCSPGREGLGCHQPNFRTRGSGPSARRPVQRDWRMSRSSNPEGPEQQWSPSPEGLGSSGHDAVVVSSWAGVECEFPNTARRSPNTQSQSWCKLHSGNCLSIVPHFTPGWLLLHYPIHIWQFIHYTGLLFSPNWLCSQPSHVRLPLAKFKSQTCLARSPELSLPPSHPPANHNLTDNSSRDPRPQP